MKLNEIKQDVLDVAGEALGRSAFGSYMNGDHFPRGSDSTALYAVLSHLTGKTTDQLRKELQDRELKVLKDLQDKQYAKYKK